MIKNVAIYARVSTEEQKKYGVSIADQKDSLTKYCKENKYKIYDYYIDEGISASTITKRKEFVRLLKDLDNIDLIIFTKLDRFSRNVRDANNLLLVLDEHNTSIKAIDEDDIDTSTADGRFIFNLKVNLAERERNKDSERINRANKYKYNVAKTVCTGKLPYGYKVSKDKKMVIDEDKKEQIVELFDFYLKTRNLNKTKKWFSQTYGKRSNETIKKYLSNSCYIGKYKKMSGEIIEDFCESIIEEETFYKVQKLLDKNVKDYQPDPSRKRHNPAPYIFSGLLKCPECGRNLAGKVNTGGSHYYNCKKHERSICSNNKCVSESDIESYFLKNIIKEVEKEKLKIQNINEKEQNKKVDISALKNKMNKLTNLYMDDLIDLDYYKQEYDDLKVQLEKAKEQNKPIKIDKDRIAEIEKIIKNDLTDFYNTLDNLEKRRLWSGIIDYAIITDKNNIEIVVY